MISLPEKLNLANLPTPITKLETLSKKLGKNVFLWRDDFTGFVESGNKSRKLEYVLADAVKGKSDTLVTCGGVQSNHARATVVLGRRLGLETTIVQRQSKDGKESPVEGNLLLDELYGARIIKVPFEEYRRAGSVYDPFLKKAAEGLAREGRKPYVIPEGASCPLGCFGYLSAIKELQETWKKNQPKETLDALFCAVGSGGTLAGLVLGAEYHELGQEKIWGVNICDSREYFESRVGKLLAETMEEFNLHKFSPRLQILDGYVGLGYAQATSEELEFYVDLARTEGVLLDPVYTGKAFRGMVEEIRKDGSRFGKNIVFLHSGGTFATFAYGDQYLGILK